MGLRETLNQKPAFGIAAAVVFLAVTGFIVYRMNRPLPQPPRATHQWFYDLGSKQLYLATINEMPPVAAPSGQAMPDGQGGGVKAYVFSCGSCEKEKERFIGFIETYTPDTKAALMSLRNHSSESPRLSPREMFEIREQGRLVSKADPVEWVHAASDEGKAIHDQARSPCQPISKAQECVPRP